MSDCSPVTEVKCRCCNGTGKIELTIAEQNALSDLEMKEVLERVGVAQSIAPTFPAALERVFEDHYWDTFQSDRDLIMQHVRTVLRQYEISTAIARAHLTSVSSTHRGDE